MTVVVIVEAVLLIIALVYIVALLRSHADILRRLAALEDGAVGGAGARPASGPDAAGAGRPPGAEIVPVTDISGQTLDGDVIKLGLGAGSPPTLLAFLSSGCASCGPLWEGMRDTPAAALAQRVVIVTHDASRESPSRLRALAPAGVELVQAQSAWEDFAIPASPHFVLTDGAGGIAGRGSALSWTQLQSMIGDAREDAAQARRATYGGAGSPAARTTADRAARAERALAGSGIGPGHPSLYPSPTAPPGPEQP